VVGSPTVYLRFASSTSGGSYYHEHEVICRKHLTVQDFESTWDIREFYAEVLYSARWAGVEVTAKLFGATWYFVISVIWLIIMRIVEALTTRGTKVQICAFVITLAWWLAANFVYRSQTIYGITVVVDTLDSYFPDREYVLMYLERPGRTTLLAFALVLDGFCAIASWVCTIAWTVFYYSTVLFFFTTRLLLVWELWIWSTYLRSKVRTTEASDVLHRDLQCMPAELCRVIASQESTPDRRHWSCLWERGAADRPPRLSKFGAWIFSREILRLMSAYRSLLGIANLLCSFVR
jgi:hypothetical protein